MLLKDIYSPAFYNQLSEVLLTVVPRFKRDKFITAVLNESFAGMELKDRMRHTTRALHNFLPADYHEAVALIQKLVTRLRQESFDGYGLAFMFLPDYIETYGLDHYAISVKAIEDVTQFVSCEFAVRPFLLKYGDDMMAQMKAWARHQSYAVRRLASEGCRPRLPWAMAVPALKRNPELVIEVLEILKDDPHEWVRRSVANNLNDIAKDHPGLVIAIARRWKGWSRETDAIIKHGCRTLLKSGHPEILEHYGLQSSRLEVQPFEITTPEISTGDHLHFSFSVKNKDTKAQIVRLEYAIHYLLKKGSYAKKVFKISERLLAAGERLDMSRKHNFRQITTRVYYYGKHELSVIVNGEEKGRKSFMLLE